MGTILTFFVGWMVGIVGSLVGSFVSCTYGCQVFLFHRRPANRSATTSDTPQKSPILVGIRRRNHGMGRFILLSLYCCRRGMLWESFLLGVALLWSCSIQLCLVSPLDEYGKLLNKDWLARVDTKLMLALSQRFGSNGKHEPNTGRTTTGSQK